MAEAISDEALGRILSRYAGLASRLLDDPSDWLGDDQATADDPGGGRDEAPSRLARLGRGLRERIAGDVHPGSPGWSTLPVDSRSEWWVDRVAAVAAPVAATPRVFGIVADRLPIQAALGAAAAGLAVCAVAREHGVTDPDAWVPLLGHVLLDRDLARGNTEEAMAVPDSPIGPADASAPQPPSQPPSQPSMPPDLDAPVRRAARSLWRLARVLIAVPGLFDERPRGALVFRALGKLPVVGLAGGVLDERGAVRRAAAETKDLLSTREGRRREL